MNIAVLSDTHGMIPAAFFTLAESCQHIFHLGDWEDESSLFELQALPGILTAIRGNCDREPDYRKQRLVELAGWRFLLVHELDWPDAIRPTVRRGMAEHKPHLVCYGHVHQHGVTRQEDSWFLNPGQAGRGRNPRSTACLLDLHAEEIRASFYTLRGKQFELLEEHTLEKPRR